MMIIFGLFILIIAVLVVFVLKKRKRMRAMAYIKDNSAAYHAQQRMLDDYDLKRVVDFTAVRSFSIGTKDSDYFEKLSEEDPLTLQQFFDDNWAHLNLDYKFWVYRNRGYNEFLKRWSSYVETHTSQFTQKVNGFSPKYLQKLEGAMVVVDKKMTVPQITVNLHVKLNSKHDRTKKSFKKQFVGEDVSKLLSAVLVVDDLPIEARLHKAQAHAEHVRQANIEAEKAKRARELEEAQLAEKRAQEHPEDIRRGSFRLRHMTVGRMQPKSHRRIANFEKNLYIYRASIADLDNPSIVGLSQKLSFDLMQKIQTL